MKIRPVAGYTFQKVPSWETQSFKPHTAMPGMPIPGVVPGTDRSQWAYFTLPLGSIQSAKTVARANEIAQPMLAMMTELTNMVHARGGNRRLARSSYREIHLLLVNVPTWFSALEQPNADYLNRVFRNQLVARRLLLFGVRLQATVGKGGFSSMVESLADTFTGGGAPLSDYKRDYDDVVAAAARSQIRLISSEEYRFANAWWNHGDAAGVPTISHTEHQHFFTTASAARKVQSADPSLADCESWPDVAQGAITFASVSDFNYGESAVGLPVEHSQARWGIDLVNQKAAAVSVRGFLEPARITAQELKNQNRRVTGDIGEAAAKNRETNDGVRKQGESLDLLKRIYDRNEAFPTLVDTSVLVAFDGVRQDVNRIVPGLTMNTMTNRQPNAWYEMMLCSPVRVNPHRHDLPISAVAFAGLANISRVGDTDGALLGFTEDDSSPVYISPRAASQGDAKPIMVVAAATRSGKALTLDTRIPTPDGWTTMGQVAVGSALFGRDGRACQATSLAPIDENPDLFRLHLGDGQHVDADYNHQWVVSDRVGRQLGARPGAAEKLAQIVERLESAAEHLTGEGDAGRIFDAVSHLVGTSVWGGAAAVTAALRMVDCVYRFEGGTRLYKLAEASNALASRLAYQRASAAVLEPGESVQSTGEMIAAGIRTAAGSPVFAIRSTDPVECVDNAVGFHERTWAQRVLTGEKGELSMQVLRADRHQRSRLLAALMVHGHIGEDGRRILRMPNTGACAGVVELVRSLGLICQTHGLGSVCEIIVHPASDRWVRIEAIEPIASRPARCIQVDSPDSTFLVGQFVPTHNTILAQWVAYQFAQLGVPQVFINPKPDSDLSDAFDGVEDKQIVNLNDFASSDGMLDPLRVSSSRESGIDMAADMLANVNPWGSVERRQLADPSIRSALRYGVEHGAVVTGQALRIAEEAEQIDQAITRPVWETLRGSPMFGALIGMDPARPGLNLSGGLTLFQVGDNSFRLPDVNNQVPWSEQSVSVRLAANILRMLTSGSMAAFRGRGGAVVHVDEAWAVEKAAPDALEEIGRMAASANVLPILYNQTPSGIVEHKMTGYLSRGLIGHISDPVEARAGVSLFPIDNTAIVNRVMVPRAFDGIPNMNALTAQYVTGQDGARHNVRGAVFYYYDLDGRLAPVEIRVPAEFLALASTTPQDVAERKQRRLQNVS